jgi:hypothetical protein
MGEIKLGTPNIGELVTRANQLMPAGNAELPAHEMLRLGHLSGLAGVEHSEFGKFVERKVRFYNQGLLKVGQADNQALGFADFVREAKRE